MPPSASSPNPGAWRWDGRDLVLRVQVQPRASRDGFAGLHGDRLKIRLTAAPVDGAANAQLTAFLAAAFGVPKRQVQLVSGASGRAKTVRIEAPARLPPELAIPPRPV